LQQFGRGLRLAPSKDYLTVLDFVGHTRAEFNYHDRFRAMIGRTSMSVQEEAERNFPHLPLDCHIQLEEKAREYILENISGYLRSMSKQRIINAIETFNNNYDVKLTLQSFLAKTKLDLARIYKCGGWSQLLYDAKMGAQPTDLQKRLVFATSKKWLSVDSLSYYQFLIHLVDQQFRVSYDGLSEKDKKRVQMFYYDLYDTPAVYSTAQNFLDTLSADSAFVAEMQDIIEIRMKQCEALELSDNSSIASVNPLMLHGIYTKAEIQVAIGTSTIERKSSAREGVERNKVSHVEAMFVDIIKDREEGSTTNYNDFAQSRVLFHWETQNRVSPESKEGKAYINGIQTMLLFVRPQNTAPEDKSRTMGYVYCGEVTLVEYSGSKPMQILWYLKTPMSEQTYDFAATHKAIG